MYTKALLIALGSTALLQPIKAAPRLRSPRLRRLATSCVITVSCSSLRERHYCKVINIHRPLNSLDTGNLEIEQNRTRLQKCVLSFG